MADDIMNMATNHNNWSTTMGTLASTAAPTEYWEIIVAKVLYGGISPVLFVIGLIGNCLSFIVFNRKSMKNSVTSLYFRVLAVTDTLVLFSAVPVFFALGAFDYDMRTHSNAACKFWIPALVACCYSSCWVLVFIASDRFIGVYLPHKYKKFCTRQRAIIGLIILFIVITASVAAFWAVVLEIDPETGGCAVGEHYVDFVGGVFMYMDLCLLNLIPSIILVSLNIAIIVKISNAVKERKNTMGGSSTKKESQKVQSPTAILLSVSLVYVLCTIPTSTKFLVLETFDQGAHGAAQRTLYAWSCDTLYLANHSINFILYCISGASFRKELFKMCGKKMLKPTSSTSHSTNITRVKSTKSDDSKI